MEDKKLVLPLEELQLRVWPLRPKVNKQIGGLGDRGGGPLMGSPPSTTHFLLSFTSYNPDITSDYRRGFQWHRGKASLLGYNQIILYPSLSVYYYPAPGPSFFTTDIRKINSIIPFFPQAATTSMTVARSKGTVTSCLLGRSSIERFATPLHTLSNYRKNEDNPPIYSSLTSMEPVWRGREGSERKNAGQQIGPTIKYGLNKKFKTIINTRHYPIMVISTRDAANISTAIKMRKAHAPHCSSRRTKLTLEDLATTNDSRLTADTYSSNIVSHINSEKYVPNLPANYPSVVISTRAVFAVITVIKNCTQEVESSRRARPGDVRSILSRDPRQAEKISRCPNPMRQPKTIRVINYPIMVISTRAINSVKLLITQDKLHTKTPTIFLDHKTPYNLDSMETTKARPKRPALRQPSCAKQKRMRRITDYCTWYEGKADISTNLATYLYPNKNRYLTDLNGWPDYERQNQNRYLTYLCWRGRACTEKLMLQGRKRASRADTVTYLGFRENEKRERRYAVENKHSTLRRRKMKTATKKRLQNHSGKAGPREEPGFAKQTTERQETFKIPKKVTPQIRIVPLPKEVPSNRKTGGYANSSKAKKVSKPRLPNVNLIQKRDPRIARRRKNFLNIPLSARNEFISNEDHIIWLDSTAIPTCEELISNSEGVILQLQKDGEAVRLQLEAIGILQGEAEYKKACYDVCSARMRIDSKLEEVKSGRYQQQKTLQDLLQTKKRLQARNSKLSAATKTAFSKPIPLLPTLSGLSPSITPPPSPVTPLHAETDRTCSGPVFYLEMKPKSSSSSASSMETDEQAKQTGNRAKYAMPSNKHRALIRPPQIFFVVGSHETSDPFFDADATVLGSESSTPRSQAEEESKDEGDTMDETPPTEDATAASGENIANMMTRLGAPKPIPEDVKRDLDGITAAVIKAGGLIANRPQEQRERRGQVLELENVDIDLGKNSKISAGAAQNMGKHCSCWKTLTVTSISKLLSQTDSTVLSYSKTYYALFFSYLTGELGPLIERPDESTLPRIDMKELLPPPSNAPVPIDFEMDTSLPEYVKEQKIEFLLVQRPVDSTEAWSFPTEENMNRIWNFVRNKLDSDYILDVCLWSRFERLTGITTLMLSTVNLNVMSEVRHEIRVYSEIEGLKFETYNKTLFIKRYGISMYVPKEHAGLNAQRILRAVFYKHRDIYTRNIKLLSKHRFETNPPGFQLGQRSRIGDAILLFDSPELAAKLKNYDEEYRFTVSKGFNVTLKGGVRGSGHQEFTPEMTSKVITGAADQALRHAVHSHSQQRAD